MITHPCKVAAFQFLNKQLRLSVVLIITFHVFLLSRISPTTANY